MLEPAETKFLLSIAAKPYRMGKPFASGYGGIWRPSSDEVPATIMALYERGLVELKIVPSVDSLPYSKGIWAFVPTKNGEMVAKMLGSS